MEAAEEDAPFSDVDIFHVDHSEDGTAEEVEREGDGESAMEVKLAPSEVEVTIWIHCTAEEAFDGASSTESLPDIFPGSGLVPGVLSAEMEGGASGMEIGATRLVRTSDGKTVRETYVQVDRPSGYAYEMTGLNPPLSAIMSMAAAQWTFEAEVQDDVLGTRIKWKYQAFPLKGYTRPLAALVAKGMLKSAMNNCLERLQMMIESELPPRWEDDSVATACFICSTEFGFVNRRHHCRKCGKLACAKCTTQRIPLPEFGLQKRVRVCDKCNSDE